MSAGSNSKILAAEPRGEIGIGRILQDTRLARRAGDESFGMHARLDRRGHDDEDDPSRGELAMEGENRRTRVGLWKLSPFGGCGPPSTNHVGFEKASVR